MIPSLSPCLFTSLCILSMVSLPFFYFGSVRAIYRELIKLIPHRTFSFSKIWIMWAHFEARSPPRSPSPTPLSIVQVRQKNLKNARAVFGQALGMAPKERIFKAYIDLEFKVSGALPCARVYVCVCSCTCDRK